jgi:DNA-binding PadR family transcriptional regulator
MSLKYGLLGFLSYGPKTGYQLHKMFFKTVRPSISLIYRQLNNMHEEGLVDFKRVERGKLFTRNVFHIKTAGRAALAQWLRTPPKLESYRDPLFMQMWYGSRVDKKFIVADIKAYMEQVRKELEYYSKEAYPLIEKTLKGSPLDRLYWELIGKIVQKQDEIYLEWAGNAVKTIEGFGRETSGLTKSARKKPGRKAQ